MIIIITNAGIVAVEGGAAAVAALRSVGAQIADDLASVASRVDDANGLLDVTRESLSGNGLGAVKVIGAVAYGGAVTAVVTSALLPALPLGAGAVAVGIASGWVAGKVFEWAFDEAVAGGQRAGSAAYQGGANGITDINYNPMGDVDVISPNSGAGSGNGGAAASSGAGGSGGGSGAAGGMGGAGGAAGASGTTVPRRDPLVLDLDGDGIETTSTRDGTVILFDHDGDGIKTGTGWVKPDDGWLVLDRNGNGTIDTGRELFGVDTRKSNGQLATDGFDALKDLDANGDGKIDAADSVFANLRIWRDLNQDGTSQANELSRLVRTGKYRNKAGVPLMRARTRTQCIRPHYFASPTSPRYSFMWR